MTLLISGWRLARTVIRRVVTVPRPTATPTLLKLARDIYELLGVANIYSVKGLLQLECNHNP